MFSKNSMFSYSYEWQGNIEESSECLMVSCHGTMKVHVPVMKSWPLACTECRVDKPDLYITYILSVNHIIIKSSTK